MAGDALCFRGRPGTGRGLVCEIHFRCIRNGCLVVQQQREHNSSSLARCAAMPIATGLIGSIAGTAIVMTSRAVGKRTLFSSASPS